MKMSKFKIGDRVKVIGKEHRYHYSGIGDIGTVKGDDNYGVRVDLDKKDKNYHGCCGACRPHHGQFIDEHDLELLPQQKIVITTGGTTTLARLYDGKKVVKTAEAKCSPSDTFDFATGAKLAFDRLTVVEPEKPAEEYSEARYEQANKICCMGVCTKSTYRKHDCPFWEMEKHVLSCSDYAATHPETQKLMDDYLEAEKEPEKPKYYNGKVVCVKTDRDFTLWKVYEFVDGFIRDDSGYSRPSSRHGVTDLSTDYWTNGSEFYHFVPLVEG